MCEPHKAARHPTKCDVINDVNLFPTVYRRIYCRFFWSYPIKHRITKASALECVVSLSKTLYLLISTGSTFEDKKWLKKVTGMKPSKQTKFRSVFYDAWARLCTHIMTVLKQRHGNIINRYCLGQYRYLLMNITTIVENCIIKNTF